MQRSTHEISPFFIAVTGGSLPVLKLIQKYGGAPDIDHGHNTNAIWTPINAAAYWGHLDCVQWLIKQGACTNEEVEKAARAGKSNFEAQRKTFLEVASTKNTKYHDKIIQIFHSPLSTCAGCGISNTIKKSLCARCQQCEYCNKFCQIKHWENGHKEECDKK